MIDIRHERNKVRNHLARARRAGTPATLTLDEWLITLKYFNYCCAYCQRLPYEVLDHMVSIAKGGGTTATNTVPACRSCNSTKDNHWKQGIFSGDADMAFKRVRAYLDTLRANDEGMILFHAETEDRGIQPERVSRQGLRLIIKELAENQGFNVSQLQRKAGVTQPLLCRYWNNEIGLVRLSALEKIAHALGVKAVDLIEEVPDEKESQ